MSKQYYFQDKKFVIESFDKQKPFASFLPGIAGKKGIPMWSFYVNRGQGISSFGLKDKNGPILEFSPANTAYMNTDRIGFKTFLKIDDTFVEAFSNSQKENVKRNMKISRSFFEIEEINDEFKFQLNVTYFTLPNEPLAGLVRRVTFKDLSGKKRTVAIADGINELIPLGISNAVYKEMSNLYRSFVEVRDLDNDFAYLKVKSSTGDTAEVRLVEEGSYFVSYVNGELVKPLIDPTLLYQFDTSLSTPNGFLDNSVKELMSKKQIDQNKIPCGFVLYEEKLPKHGSIHIDTIIGAAKNQRIVYGLLERINKEYFESKFAENDEVIEALLTRVTTKTAYPLFDEYIKQNQLDNLLRGGHPIILTSKDGEEFTYHIYSRKHGDLERDYNFFVIEPEFYSQGNSNFRDVCQNRRNDVFLEPKVFDFNVQMFASLIQLDGYNPLSVSGVKYRYTGNIDELCINLFKEDAEKLKPVFLDEFSPGDVINAVRLNNIKTDLSDDEIFAEIFQHVDVNYQATFGEGYWIDHFTYILDLVESVLKVYPDKLKEIVFDKNEYKYFVSPATVYPKTEKIVVRDDGKVRQYGSTNHYNEDKVAKMNLSHTSNWLTDASGLLVKTNLFGKLFVLLVNKISLLDPHGLGIEMEADKPGWNDAMNGLPGLFGSGVSETIETYRIAKFLEGALEDLTLETIPLFSEFINFMYEINNVLEERPMSYWEKSNDIRAGYLVATAYGVREVNHLNVGEVKNVLARILHKLEISIEEIKQIDDVIVPTFLTYEATKFDMVEENGGYHYSHYGLPTAKVSEFELNTLPPFLEAPARLLKISNDKEYNQKMYKNIKASGIYDEVLNMYKTSDDLDGSSFEIGRIKAFSKGWLERESNFLHMSYKYLYGLLKSGMYEEFYEDIKTNVVCFMDPSVYGRSTLENSSFIATTNNPNPELHGQGFVARLTGSTAEMLSIWTYMMMGPNPFEMNDGELTLKLQPKLRNDWFDDRKQVSFQFLKNVTVTYVNGGNFNTYDNDVVIEKIYLDDELLEVPVVSGENALKVRNGEIRTIKIHWNKK